MINMQQYKPNSKLTREQLLENNFKYIDGCYSYRFSVYKYKKETTLWCSLYVNLEESTCTINVHDGNNNTYPAFFNRKYGGTHKVVESIDRKVRSQLNMFIKNGILYKKGKKKNDLFVVIRRKNFR